jgi:hypothetical protein
MMVKYNAAKKVYEQIEGGKVVASAKTKRELGSSLTAVEITSAPKEYFSVEERFSFIEEFVGLCVRKVVPSVILTGSGGIGKTETVLRTLKKLGKKEDLYGVGDGEYSSNGGDFLVVKGFSTAKALYRTLWENNGKIIIFDDADSVHKDPIAANILKGALDSGERRVISWGAEFGSNEELPNRFEFYGQVIFISNLPLAKFPQALISRAVKVDLTLTTEEKVERIEYIFTQIEGDKKEKAEVLAFVKKYADRFTDLNIRSALGILKLRQNCEANFERIALYTATA